MNRRNLKAILFTCAAVFSTNAAAMEMQSFEVKSRLIENFKIGSDEQRFGPLEFAGGLEMIGHSEHFGALSGIALRADQANFLAIADTGFWLSGTIERNANHQPTGIKAAIATINGANDAPIGEKWQADAEGIAFTSNGVSVSYERAHRIARYAIKAGNAPTLVNEFAPPVPLYELRQNRGFEGIAYAPTATPLNGALVGISEKSLDKNGNIMGFAQPVDGEPFEFSLARKDDFDVTDIGFLPSGDLVVLERRFNVVDSIGMRLRHIKAATIKPKQTVDGATLLTADFQYQIDNMEGLAITVDEDGTPRLTLLSDDNHSLLQRNLLLEFRLVGDLN